MPDATITTLCDAVVTHLSSQSLSMSLTASRTYLPDFEREELTAAQVSVFPQGTQTAIASRDSQQFIYTLNVVVRVPVSPAADPDISTHLYFAEQVTDALALKSLADCSYSSIQNEQAFDLEALADRNEFLSIITVTYLTIK